MNIKIWRILLYIYLLLLIIFVVIKFNGSIDRLFDRIKRISIDREVGIWNYNLMVLKTTSHYFKNISEGYARFNILGNIIPFAPLGFLLPLSIKGNVSFLKILVFCFCLILCIEVFQFVTMLGFFDIDDIWLNLIGCIVGYVVYLICKKVKILACS